MIIAKLYVTRKSIAKYRIESFIYDNFLKFWIVPPVFRYFVSTSLKVIDIAHIGTSLQQSQCRNYVPIRLRLRQSLK